MSAEILTSPEDVVNAALGRLGIKQRIGKLIEGSEPAKLALDLYGQSRDEALRTGNFDFARRDVDLTLLKSAPAGGYVPPVLWNPHDYPPPGWKFEYVYPTDCLKVRNIRPRNLTVMEFDPSPVPYNTPNDPYATGSDPDWVEAKVIVCNVPDALLTYTGQITDPSNWDSTFSGLMIAMLAKRLSPAVANQLLQASALDERMEKVTADVTQG